MNKLVVERNNGNDAAKCSVMYLEHFYAGEAVVFKGCTRLDNILKMLS